MNLKGLIKKGADSIHPTIVKYTHVEVADWELCEQMVISVLLAIGFIKKCEKCKTKCYEHDCIAAKTSVVIGTFCACGGEHKEMPCPDSNCYQGYVLTEVESDKLLEKLLNGLFPHPLADYYRCRKELVDKIVKEFEEN